MTIIGITGPTGAGKTTALRVLEELGVEVLDCDAIYHRLLASSLPLRQALEARFGDIFDETGLNRRKLGKLVWADETAREDLNQITHHFILAQLRQELARAQAEGRPGAAIDAALLLESGAGELCHTTVAVVAPQEVRIQRIMNREGIDRAYAQARVQAQKPAEWFVSHCRHTLVNDSTEEAFRQKARALFCELLQQSDGIQEEFSHV